MSNEPTVWITYAWLDNDEGDFSYLVSQLAAIGVRAKYDKIALVPGQRLWDQIGREIIEGSYSGWAYLLTPASLASEACRVELAYALYRALNGREAQYPLLGLLNGVRFDDVPNALKVRLCVDLGSATWREEIKAGLERRAPELGAASTTQYVWTIGERAPGIVVEVRPRFGEVMYWRFAVPSDASVERWGFGPSGGGGLSGVSMNRVEGVGELAGTAMKWFGTGDRLSPGVSAYAMLGERPGWIAFGEASEPFGLPGKMERIELT